MKKIFSIIAICLTLVLAVPAVPVHAMDKSQFIIRCRSTVEEASTGLEAVLYGSVFPDGSTSGDQLRQNVITGLSTFDFTQLSEYDYYFVGASLSSGTIASPASMNIYVFWFDSSDVPLYVTSNSPSSTSSNSFFASIGTSFKVCSMYATTSTYGSWTSPDTLTVSNNISGNTSPYGLCTNVQFVLDCNFAVNAAAEITIKSGVSGGTWGNSSVKNWYLNGGYSECTDLFANTQGYNAQGQIVNGSGEPEPEFESNENHMYLKSCDAGFCKPYSSTDLSSAGGGYLYVNYTYDNWINSHSSDYWVNIRTVVNVDGTQYSGINTRALDLNGVNVLTFSESTVPNDWTNEGFLFVEFPNTVVSTYKAGYVYSIPYPTFASTDSGGVSNRSRFLGNGRNRLFLTPHGGRGYDITDEPLGDFLESIFDIVSHERFTLTVTVWLQDTEGNRSGEFTKTFNLITGVATTNDTSITDNDNPFEPDPMYPDIPDGSGNDSNSVAPIVNNVVINGTGTIGYDPGYRDLKEDLDKDPDGNFTQYLAPFKNNEVGGFVGDFLDDMPTALKTIFVGGFGVLTLLGIYRFIRRG